MKRFKILNYSQDVVYRASTTEEIFKWLSKQDMGLNSFYIECIVDEIEVSADDFLDAWNRGETPEDLQFF